MRRTIILILLLGLLTACGSSTSIPTNDQYRTGYSGLQIQFVRNNPPVELIETIPFAVALQVHNRGPFDVKNAFLVLSYDTDYVGMASDTKSISLEGRNIYNPQGESRAYFFQAETRKLDAESQRRKVPIIASLCYVYESLLTDVICLDKGYETGQDRGRVICTPQDKRYSGQGGPVGISSLDITILPNEETQYAKVYLDMVVTHSGNGIIVQPDAYKQACTSGTPSESINKVLVKSAALSDFPLVCSDQYVTLRNNQARLRCESTHEINIAAFPFNAPVYLELEYGYVDSVTTNVEIIRR